VPSKPRRPCNHQGCPNLIPIGTSYCSEHKPKDTRPNSDKRGYGGSWRKIRAYVLRATPYCNSCGAIATEVHHIVSIADGGTNDYANLMPLCKSCHSRVTGRNRAQ